MSLKATGCRLHKMPWITVVFLETKQHGFLQNFDTVPVSESRTCHPPPTPVQTASQTQAHRHTLSHFSHYQNTKVEKKSFSQLQNLQMEGVSTLFKCCNCSSAFPPQEHSYGKLSTDPSSPLDLYLKLMARKGMPTYAFKAPFGGTAPP